MKATMRMSPSQLLLATHAQLSSELLASINNATYVYVVRIHMFTCRCHSQCCIKVMTPSAQFRQQLMMVTGDALCVT